MDILVSSNLERLIFHLVGNDATKTKESVSYTHLDVYKRQLHLLAIAHAANVDLTLEDFNDFQERVPHLADLKPSGKYVFQDLYNVGGVPAVMKYLLKNGFLHGDRITCTGKTCLLYTSYIEYFLDHKVLAWLPYLVRLFCHNHYFR